MVAYVNISAFSDFFIAVKFERKDQRVDRIKNDAEHIHEVHDMASLFIGWKQETALFFLLFAFFLLFLKTFLFFFGSARRLFAVLFGNVRLFHQIFSCILLLIVRRTSSIVISEVSMGTASSALFKGAHSRVESCSSRAAISCLSFSKST